MAKIGEQRGQNSVLIRHDGLTTCWGEAHNLLRLVFRYVAKIGQQRGQDSQLEKDAEQDEREDEQTADRSGLEPFVDR